MLSIFLRNVASLIAGAWLPFFEVSGSEHSTLTGGADRGSREMVFVLIGLRGLVPCASILHLLGNHPLNQYAW
jgi:hypothetical protein